MSQLKQRERIRPSSNSLFCLGPQQAGRCRPAPFGEGDLLYSVY